MKCLPCLYTWIINRYYYSVIKKKYLFRAMPRQEHFQRSCLNHEYTFNGTNDFRLCQKCQKWTYLLNLVTCLYKFLKPYIQEKSSFEF